MKLQALLLFAVLLFPSAAAAQQAATLTGTLTDPQGAAIADAEVIAAAGDAAHRATSGADGRFTLTLPPGRYRLRVAHPSFASAEQEVTLRAGETRELRLALALEPLAATVVVTAEAQPVTAENTAAPVTVISGEEIVARQARDVISVLATTPGVAFSRLGRDGGITSLFLNGGNSNYTKFLVDGATVNEPGGGLNLANFSLENVEKIEIVRGAASALYGTDAMAGVVQVFTRRGTTRRPVLELEGEGGKFSTGRGAANLSGALGSFDYSAAVAHFRTDGQEVNDFFRNTTLSGNFGWRGAGHSLRLALRNNTSDAGGPGQTLFHPPNLDQHTGLENFSAHLSWEFSTGARWRHRLSGHHARQRQLFENRVSDFCFSDPPFICDFPFTVRNVLNRAGGQAQSSYVGPRGGVSVGYQYEVENGFLGALHARRNNQGGYVEGRWQAAPRLVLTGGFRAEGNASFGTRVVPRAGVVVTARHGGDFWGATRLRVNYGLGIKEPTLTQSFADNPCFPGNPDLDPERAQTVSVGVEQILAGERVRFSADWFDHRYRDIASFTFCIRGGPCPVPFPPECTLFSFGTFFNTDRARARGTNVAVESAPAPWLRLAGHYSFVDSRVLESPNAFDPALMPGNRLFRRPAHSGSVVAHLSFGPTSWSVVGTFVGRKTDSDFLSFRFDGDCFGPCRSSTAPYAKVDLGSSVRLGRSVTLFGRVENLFDAEYEEASGFAGYRRLFRAGMRLRLGGE